MGIFVRQGRLALPWRIIGYLFLFMVVQVVARFAKVDRSADGTTLVVRNVLYAVLRAGGVVALTVVFRRHLDKRRFADLGLGPLRSRFRDLALGALGGCAVVGAIFAVELALGWATVTGTEWDASGGGKVAAIQLASLAELVAVGISEEVALRGYVYTNVAQNHAAWVATAITGLIFGLLHAPMRGFGAPYLVGVMALSGVLVVSRLVTGSLWFAIGWHATWDWAQDALFGISNVGEPDFGHALLHVEQRGPVFVVGPAPTLEGGLLFIGATALILAGAVAWSGRRIAWSATGT